MIYLDYQATTPPAPEVVAAMRPWLEENYANPHSPSRWGREAAAAIEHARDQILTAIGHDEGRFAFTSGATEALNWAVRGTLERSERRKIVTIATEHAAVLDTCDWLEGQGYSIVKLPVGAAVTLYGVFGHLRFLVLFTMRPGPGGRPGTPVPRSCTETDLVHKTRFTNSENWHRYCSGPSCSIARGRFCN